MLMLSKHAGLLLTIVIFSFCYYLTGYIVVDNSLLLLAPFCCNWCTNLFISMAQNNPNKGNDRNRQGNQGGQQQSTGNKGTGQSGRQGSGQQGLQDDELSRDRRQGNQSGKQGDSQRSDLLDDDMDA